MLGLVFLGLLVALEIRQDAAQGHRAPVGAIRAQRFGSGEDRALDQFPAIDAFERFRDRDAPVVR